MKHIKTLYEWRDIKGYEGLYQVNQFGQIRNKKTGQRRKACNNHGYERLGLYKNGKYKFFLVHRLVAEAFIPNPENYDTVDHLDFNTKNNNVLNLRWIPREENAKRRRGEI